MGAVAGGLFVLRAATTQWKRDKRETSRQAARRLLASLASIEGVFATWVAGQQLDSEVAGSAFNGFSSATVTELPFIEDDEVCARVREHVLLSYLVFRTAPNRPLPKNLLEAVRRHADAVTEALEAYIRESPLPSYRPIPKTSSGAPDIAALLSWPGDN